MLRQYSFRKHFCRSNEKERRRKNKYDALVAIIDQCNEPKSMLQTIRCSDRRRQ